MNKARCLNEIRTVKTAESMARYFANLIHRKPSFVGVQFRYEYEEDDIVINPEEPLNNQRIVTNITSIIPREIVLAVPEAKPRGISRTNQTIIRLENPGLPLVLEKFFEQPITFVGYNLKLFLICLQQLKINPPKRLWDVMIFEKLRCLGRFNRRYFNGGYTANLTAKAQQEALAAAGDHLSLAGLCLEYGVNLPGFLNSETDTVTSEEASIIAQASAMLYQPQIQRAEKDGILEYCEEIEMPWIVTNAGMEWKGVKVHYIKAQVIINKSKKQLNELKKKLSEEYGIGDCLTRKDLEAFFRRIGLIDRFVKGGRLSFDDKTLTTQKNTHPAVQFIIEARKLQKILSNKILNPNLICTDMRVHPTHFQLGTDTGRQICRYPNVTGLSRYLKPLIIPEEGYGIGEADYGQFEVGIAGAYYEDENLIQMYNSGDVYTAMAMLFAQDSVDKNDLDLDHKSFKKKYPDLRDKMKVLTLGIIYGMTARGIANHLGIKEKQARGYQEKFIEMFPELKKRIKHQQKLADSKDYVLIMKGVKRHKGNSVNMQSAAPLRNWEKNWFVNTPIQGSAAIVFKSAGNELRRLHEQNGSSLILSVHDSFIFETPLDRLEDIAEQTREIMCNTLKSFFPVLMPRVDININSHSSWNKDGDLDLEIEDVTERWMDI